MIFIVLIAAFGMTAYEGLRRTAFKGVDSKLDAYAQVVAGGLEEMNDGSIDLELSRTARKLFRGADHPYYFVWDQTGRIIHRSSPPFEAPPLPSPARQSRGSHREVSVTGPAGTLVLVGQKAKQEVESVREYLLALLASSTGLMLVALVGGWFLAGRVLRPIERISATASAISAANLSRRIDVAQTEDELGRLATTLNETFGRLEQAFERQARFTADASHELRTPLSVVMTHAEVALRNQRSPEEYREALQTVLEASRQMKALVEGLLTLARADARQAPTAEVQVPLLIVIEEVAAALGPLALERRVAVTIHARPLNVTGDCDRLREAVTNLLTNAIRYTPENGKVDVTLREEAGVVVLQIADTGIGIPEKDQRHLFERFFRVDTARARDRGGAGLGLAITKGIVEAHRGTIAFSSQEGSGTTFTVRFPQGAKIDDAAPLREV
jgi:two-component system OmpR family sensor kinase